MIWFIFWISSFPAWDYSVKGLYQVIIAEGGISRASDALNLVSYAQGYGYDVTEQILKRLGGPLILGILALLAFPLILKESLKNRAERDLFSLYGPFVLVSVLIPLLYLYNPVFDPIRLVIYAAMLGAAFTAYLLAYLLRSAEKGKNRIGQRIVSLFALAILAVLFLLGFLNIYPSPYNLTPSYHTTQSEVIGMNYFYAHRDVNISVMCITAAPGRFAEAFLTPTERRVQRLPQYMLPDKGLAPWHFGYDSSFSLSDSYAGKTNLLTVQRDTVIYTDYLPDMARFRFTPRDFERLDDDPGVNDLYSNGGFEIREISKPPVMVIS
jgi:hypothetical protein